jgi:hypothetical protein
MEFTIQRLRYYQRLKAGYQELVYTNDCFRTAYAIKYAKSKVSFQSQHSVIFNKKDSRPPPGEVH